MKPYWNRYHEEQGELADAGGSAVEITDKPAVDDDKPPPGMLDAINEGLKYTEPKDGEAVITDPKLKAEADAKVKAGADVKVAADAAAKTRADELAAMSETDRAAAVAADKKKDADADALAAADAKKADEAKKNRPLAELELTEAEKKVLKKETQARFGEVLTRLKDTTANFEKLQKDHSTVAAARDSMLGILDETGTTPEQLSNLLAFSAAINSGTRQGLTEALALLESNRVGIMRMLGKEGPGYDPLKERGHEDLDKDVEEGAITRARALEIVAARNERARVNQRESGERQRAEGNQRSEQAVNTALNAIDKWAKDKASGDLDYKEKEPRVTAEITAIIREGKIAPDLWLSTIERMYNLVSVTKAPVMQEQQPLRPKGAKAGGAKPASMLDAVNQGLNYSK